MAISWGQVMTLWCKHQNLPRDTVLFFAAGRGRLDALDADATAAGQGWSPGQLVVLDALLAADEAAQVGFLGQLENDG